MPKMPDFSKFDLQGIVNSVKSIINPEAETFKAAEGDLIGLKMETISALLRSAADRQAQAAKELTQINNLMGELYKDLTMLMKAKGKEVSSESETAVIRKVEVEEIKKEK